MVLSDLNFSLGKAFEEYIKKQCKAVVNAQDGPRSPKFFLVVEFTRSLIKLNPESVGLIIQACFGGSAKLFKVSHLCNWSYKFCVSSLEVGFEIIRGGNLSTDLYSMNFLLWGEGDDDLKHLYRRYHDAASKEWTVVSNTKSRRSYVQAVQ